MKHTLLALSFCILFLGVGCDKNPNLTSEIDMSADCTSAEYPFACFLDKATSAKDPNLCDNADSKRITCISAYEELLETQIDCNALQEPSFKMECEQLHASQNNPTSIPANTTDNEAYIDSDYMNN